MGKTPEYLSATQALVHCHIICAATPGLPRNMPFFCKENIKTATALHSTWRRRFWFDRKVRGKKIKGLVLTFCCLQRRNTRVYWRSAGPTRSWTSPPASACVRTAWPSTAVIQAGSWTTTPVRVWNNNNNNNNEKRFAIYFPCQEKDVRVGLTHPCLVISHVDGKHMPVGEKRSVVLETSTQDRARKDKQRYGELCL